jgi:hypothetical protein
MRAAGHDEMEISLEHSGPEEHCDFPAADVAKNPDSFQKLSWCTALVPPYTHWRCLAIIVAVFWYLSFSPLTGKQQGTYVRLELGRNPRHAV